MGGPGSLGWHRQRGGKFVWPYALVPLTVHVVTKETIIFKKGLLHLTPDPPTYGVSKAVGKSDGLDQQASGFLQPQRWVEGAQKRRESL